MRPIFRGKIMIAMRIRSALALVLALGVMAAVPRTVSAAETGAPSAAVRAAWKDLAGDDEARATRAALVLAKSPAETLALLRAELYPIKADPKRVAKLVRELDSDKYTERERALKDLRYLGKCVKTDLQKALAASGSAEVKKSIRKLLDAIARAEKKPEPAAAAPLAGARRISVSNVNGKVSIMVNGVPLDLTPRVIKPVGPPHGWVRAARAVGVLEFLNTDEARRLLRELADGEADALPTQAARAALRRLGK
jgi:hypothetical protein